MSAEVTAQSFAIYALMVMCERSRVAACTEAMMPSERIPPLENPPGKPLSTLEQGGGERAKSDILGGCLGRQTLAGLARHMPTLQIRLQMSLQLRSQLDLQMGLQLSHHDLYLQG